MWTSVPAERVPYLDRHGHGASAGPAGVVVFAEEPQRVAQPAQAHHLRVVTESEQVLGPLIGRKRSTTVAKWSRLPAGRAAQNATMPERYSLSIASPSSPSCSAGRRETLSGRPCLVEVVVAQARHHERPQQRWLQLDAEEGCHLDGALLDRQLVLRRETVDPAERRGQE